MTRLAAVGIAAAVAAATVGAGYATDAGGDARPTALGPGLVTVEVGIQHSRFSVDELRVAEGTTVRFVVRNDDPIGHELVVGAADVHRRHETGGEAQHPPVPGEVSVAPGEVGVTVYDFDEPGAVTFACHLPGHVAYGMVGEVQVEAL